MQQLTGLDAAFLDVEDDHQPTHISQLVVLDMPRSDADPYTAWRRQLAERLPVLEPLRRRLVEVPFGLDHPYWITEEVDLDFHVRHCAVPPPGTDDELDTLVARLIVGPMDRDRPLWVSYVISGLAPTEASPYGRFALLTMIHHAAVDGASGAALLALMLDHATEPGSSPNVGADVAPEVPDEWPSTLGLLGRAAWHGVVRPGRALLLAARAGQQVAAATRQPAVIDLADRVRRSLRGPIGDLLNLGRTRDPDAAMPRLPAVTAPSTPFNGPIGRYRRFSHRSVSLSEVKQTARAAGLDGVTVNDVVVAACAGALRNYLVEHDALPDVPLAALIPVSLRADDDSRSWTNRVSGTIASLPTDVESPRERLVVAHRALDTAKAVFAVTPAGLAPDGVDLGAPMTSALVSRATLWWVSHARGPFNVVISNIPGPREPLFIDGARARHYFPVSAIVDGQGLNMTLQSYAGAVEIGLLSCAQRVPDLPRLADLVVEEFAALRRAGP